jgi:signal peptidase I
MVPNDRVELPNQPFPHTATPNGQPLAGTGRAVATSQPKKKEETPAVKDAFREIVETVVFVIVLVLLLKTFVAEAFVIPTGSMAETLLGYQKWTTCPQCGHRFAVNCSSEVDPQQGPPVEIIACTCPNCRFKDVWKERDPLNNSWRVLRESPPWGSGDRVLVSKFPFDNGHFADAGRPDRFNVVVFKYPFEPQKGQIPMNYIKRLCGLPGETIAIFNGDLYVCDTIEYPENSHPRPVDPKDLWKIEYTFTNDDLAVNAFHAGRFEILRKTPDLILAMRRLVYDNDQQAQDLIAAKAKPRWQDRGGWAANDPIAPRVFRHAGDDEAPQWLRYQHLIVNRSNVQPLAVMGDPKPELIRNFMGYNTGERADGQNAGRPVESYWVGDLALDCTATVEALQGDLILELSKGADRFQARFDLKDGTVALSRLANGKPEEIAKVNSGITKTGEFKLRFANVDSRLTLWVNGNLPFQDRASGQDDRRHGGVDYPAVAADQDNPNNYEPASIGAARGAKVSVAHLSLWRDTYYTPRTENGTSDLRTMYVQPGHFLCLGDNSSESSDSRYWGLVPQRLLLGRALVVYYPFGRAGLIR